MRISPLKITTFLVLFASFTVVYSAFLLKGNVQRIVSYWGESLQMTVYLKEAAGEETIQLLKERLSTDDRVDKLEFVSSELALTRFREQMQNYAPDLMNDKELVKAIPASFQFSMNASLGPLDQVDAMKTLAEQLKQDPQIEDVHYGQDWVKNYSEIFSLVNGTGGLVLAIILLGVFFIVSNSIRSSIQSQREKIEILELIGATNAYIRRPYYQEALLMSLGASLGAVVITWTFFVLIKDTLTAKLSFFQIGQHLQFLSLQTIAAILVGSAMIGILAAFSCLQSLNSGWSQARRSAEGEI